MGNETLAELKKNVRKYEIIEIMITPKTPFDIETEIIQSKIQQINKDNNSKKPEIDRLREEVENSKLLINSESPKQNYVDYQYNTSTPRLDASVLQSLADNDALDFSRLAHRCFHDVDLNYTHVGSYQRSSLQVANPKFDSFKKANRGRIQNVEHRLFVSLQRHEHGKETLWSSY
ncbi:Hypothetical protein CINCED_3A025623 [Cinara cedri]|uniref:Uncharacterized protein n=1 Tax=Cinara cedri TaxID=506608 RepID=A0A5E4MG11_9HEMI|nr:Hypothetical protein CINCED_3A025623 [Cinara cedri]